MMDEIKKAAVWQEALDVASAIMQLCEEFTDDQNVLAGHLRELAIDIPASIASDLTHKRQPNTDPLIRCAIVMELVHKVYPAIDTDTVESGLEKITTRIEKNTFAEQLTTASSEPVIGTPAPVPEEKSPEAALEVEASPEEDEEPSSKVISIKQDQ